MRRLGVRECFAIGKGLATYLPPARFLLARRSGGNSEDVSYCYAVWMRYLRTMEKFGWSPGGKRVGELGPGNSVGVGVAALLSGAHSYFGFDVVRYRSSANSGAFAALVENMNRLYAERHPIPGPDEYPQALPLLDSYEFPPWLDQEGGLASHQKKVVEELTRLPESHVGFERLQYVAPYASADLNRYRGSFDAFFSQAVFEHVRDLEDTYRLIFGLLKPGGWSWHMIDFRCHGLSTDWNGHWQYPVWLWKVTVGRRQFLLNRVPLSGQIKAAEHAEFKVEKVFRYVEGEYPALGRKSRLGRGDFAQPFCNLSSEDLSTQSAMVVLRKAF